jgi:hypothetical protein
MKVKEEPKESVVVRSEERRMVRPDGNRTGL